MKIIESFIMSKTKDADACEDGLLISSNYIAIIDGATSKSNFRWGDGITSGKHAMQVLIEDISRLEPSLSAHQAFNFLNESLRDEYAKNGFDIKSELPSYLEASIIIYSVSRKEVWRYGDCQLIINRKKHLNEKQIDIVAKRARSAYVNALIASGKATYQQLLDHDDGRDFIMPLLKIQSSFGNREGIFGYPVMNGIQKIIDSCVEIFSVKEGDEIVMASDGYPRLMPTLDASEKNLKKILQNDPLLVRDFLSTKGLHKDSLSYDDRCYIRLIV